jgi:hypothetical protein
LTLTSALTRACRIQTLISRFLLMVSIFWFLLEEPFCWENEIREFLEEGYVLEADVSYEKPGLGATAGDATIMLKTLEGETFELVCNTETGIRVVTRKDSPGTSAPEANLKKDKTIGKSFDSFEQLLRRVSPKYGVKFDEGLAQGILDF